MLFNVLAYGPGAGFCQIQGFLGERPGERIQEFPRQAEGGVADGPGLFALNLPNHLQKFREKRAE